MAEKGYTNKLLFAAFSCLAMVSIIEANMVFYDGFTIEMPVWFELIPRLRPPMMAPYKETSGHPNAIPNTVPNGVPIPGRPQFQMNPNREPQMDYNQQGYSNFVQIQPKPIQYPAPQYPRAPEIFYRPTMPPKPAVIYSVPTTRRIASPPTTTTVSIPPAVEDEGEEYEESPETS